MTKLLIVAAWDPELAHVRSLCAGAPPSQAECASECVIETIGVGLVESGLHMAAAIARHRPDVALFVGTAGVITRSGAPRIGDVVVVSRVGLTDAGALSGASEVPRPMPQSVHLDAALCMRLAEMGAMPVCAANPLGITVDDGLAEDLARADYDVEHLEAFAFARACELARLRAGIVLGIANAVGSAGRREWLNNHERVSELVGDFVWKAMRSLG